MYLATGKFLFWDDTVLLQNSNMDDECCYTSGFKSYSSTTIAGPLNYCHIGWAFYAEGYRQNPRSSRCYPNYYDASDNPFTYFPNLVNSSEVSSRNFRDYKKKTFFRYSRSDTVVFMVADESGGCYDHVSIPMKNPIDDVLYDPRIPFIDVGERIKRNYISYVQIEFSSLIKFIEWIWLKGELGQLGGTLDTIVNNISDRFDQQKTVIIILSYSNYFETKCSNRK